MRRVSEFANISNLNLRSFMHTWVNWSEKKIKGNIPQTFNFESFGSAVEKLVKRGEAAMDQWEGSIGSSDQSEARIPAPEYREYCLLLDTVSILHRSRHQTLHHWATTGDSLASSLLSLIWLSCVFLRNSWHLAEKLKREVRKMVKPVD